MFSIKIALVGGRASGKTSIARSLIGEEFDENYYPTPNPIGYRVVFGDIGVLLEIYDCAGTSKLNREKLKILYDRIDACVSIFDASSQDSFNEAECKVDQVREYNLHVKVYHVANKVDIFEGDIPPGCLPCSCRMDFGVRELFAKIMHDFYPPLRHGTKK